MKTAIAIGSSAVWLASALIAFGGAREDRFEPVVVEVVEHRLSEELVEKALKVRRNLDITDLVVPPGDRRYREDEIFRDKSASDLILGISVDGASRGHAYLVLGLEGIEDWIRRKDYAPLVQLLDQGEKRVRFDGRMVYMKHRITTRVYPPQSRLSAFFEAPPLVEPILNNGVFLRYRAIPLAHRLNMITRLYEISERVDSVDPIRASSCVTATCKLIWKDGGFLSSPAEASFWRNVLPGWKRPHHPGGLLRHLARHGLVDHLGNALEPEIYTLNIDPDEFWRDRPTPGNLGESMARGAGILIDRFPRLVFDPENRRARTGVPGLGRVSPEPGNQVAPMRARVTLDERADRKSNQAK